MSSNNETTTKFKVDISELKKAMQDAKRSIAVANSEFKAVASSMDDWSKSTDGISAKLKQLDSNLNSQKIVLKSLEEQYELTVKEMGEGSKAADDLKVKINNQKAVINGTQKDINKWNTALNELKNESGQADGAVDGLKNSLKGAGDEADKTESGFTVLKATIADLASKAISNAIDALKDFVSQANEVDKAVNGLQSSTGATAKQMEEYKDIMKDIYNGNYGESYDDVAQSMGQVVQVMGDLEKTDLKNITTNGLALRDTFGFEMPESMRAVNSLMKQFGITSDEAYNLIAQGAQNGLNQNDDLLDVINEYAVQFKNSGYSANDMFNMLKNGADSGVWSVDKLGDAVKEMNIRFSDGTVAESLNENAKALGLSKKEIQSLQTEYNKGGDSAQKAVGKMIDSILNVKDETKQYQLGVSVFGTMWEDLGADAINSLMSTKGELTSTKNTMDEIKDTKYDDLGSSLSQLGRLFKDEILKPIQDQIMPKLEEFVKYCVNNFPEIKQSVLDVVNALKEWLPTLTTIGTAIATYLVATKIIAFFEAIKNGTVALKLMTAAQTVLNAVMSLNPIGLVVAAIAALVAAFVLLWNKSDSFREFWTKLWEKIKSGTKTVVDAIGKFFTQSLPKFIDKAVEFFKQLPTKIGLWLANTLIKVTEWTSNMTTKAKTAASNFINKVVEFIKQLPSKVWTWLVNVVTKVASWGTNLASKGKEAAKKLFNSIVDKIKDLPNSLKSIGKDLVKGLWNGINDMTGWVKDKIKGFGKSVTDGLKKFFKIKSPSRLMAEEVGRWLPEGIAVGIDKNAKSVMNSMRDLAVNTVGAAQSGLASSGSAGTIRGGVVNNFTQNNYSPKSLSKLDIYRRTKNLLGFAGGAS